MNFPPLPPLPKPSADLIGSAYALLDNPLVTGDELTAMRVALAPYRFMGATLADAVENDEVRTLLQRLADMRYLADSRLLNRHRAA